MAHTLRQSLHDDASEPRSLDTDEHRVNPLWMITVALAILFGFGVLLMLA